MVEIRGMRPEDWPEVEAIYAAGIRTGEATFETETPSWEEFDAGRLAEHRLVAVEDDRVVGWAALSPTSPRPCYAGVVENSVYVAADARGRGVGRALLEALVSGADDAGLWTIQTSVFPENTATLAPARAGRFPRRRPARAGRATRRGVAGHAPARAPLPEGLTPTQASCQRRNTTQALWPPKPNEFDTPISTC